MDVLQGWDRFAWTAVSGAGCERRAASSERDRTPSFA
jgi:hypothetical protein